jgi:hypothetical protein
MLSFDTILKVHILMLIQAKVVQTGQKVYGIYLVQNAIQFSVRMSSISSNHLYST